MERSPRKSAILENAVEKLIKAHEIKLVRRASTNLGLMLDKNGCSQPSSSDIFPLCFYSPCRNACCRRRSRMFGRKLAERSSDTGSISVSATLAKNTSEDL